jgi:uncharacterized spore protein YtfJ
MENQSREALASELADKLGSRANARVVFGEAVDREGATVIPVAQVRMGFGAGSGTQAQGKEGTGGGGGMRVEPMGFIKLQGGKAVFRRIRGKLSPLRGFLGAAVLVSAVLFGLRPIARLALTRR